MQPRFPTNKQRITIAGRTGSGKTVAAVWHLSIRDLDKFPWIILDYKTDELINSIERAEHVDVGFIPKKKDTGIFIAHPMPKQDDIAVNNWLLKIWERGNCGVFVDEGFMVADLPNYDLLLTQGRSLRIPMITNTQRPVWISRFCFSEADFFQVFDLTDKRDRQTVLSFIPTVPVNYDLPDYYSYYYDVAKKSLTKFSPVPTGDDVLDVINHKLKTPRKIL